MDLWKKRSIHEFGMSHSNSISSNHSFSLFIFYYKSYLFQRQSHSLVTNTESFLLDNYLSSFSKIVIPEFKVFSPDVDSHQLFQLGHGQFVIDNGTDLAHSCNGHPAPVFEKPLTGERS